METDWDDSRILARVEARRGGSQPELPGVQNLVVRLYDRGLADGRLDEPEMFYDSERAEGDAGLFTDSDKAESFRVRIRDAYLAARRLAEGVRSARKEALPGRLDAKQLEHDEAVLEEDAAKAEAKAARGRADDAKAQQRKLWREAEHPHLVVECHPGGAGFAVRLAESVTDPVAVCLMSTLEEAANEPPSPLSSAIEDAIAATGAKRRPVESARKMPSSVKGADDKRIAVGDLVAVDERGVDRMIARVVKIAGQEVDGCYLLDVTDDVGNEHTVRAIDCTKQRKSDFKKWGE